MPTKAPPRTFPTRPVPTHTAPARIPSVPAPRRVRWGQQTTAWCALAVILTGLGHLSHHPLTWVGTIALLTAAGATAALGWRTNYRHDRQRAALLVAQHRLTGIVELRSWKVAWKGWPGQPASIRVQFVSSAAAIADPFKGLLVDAVNSAWRASFAVGSLEAARGRARLVARPVVIQEGRPEQEMVDRATEVVRQVFGAKASLVGPEVEDGELEAFTVRHQAGAKLSNAEMQNRVEDIVSSMLPGRWRAGFDLPTDTIRFSRRPQLPTMVHRPTEAVRTDDPNFLHIPQAIDEDGNVCYWDISGVMAHQLKAGRTRTGKTVSLIGDAVEAARRGFRVCVIDPKRIEFLGMRDWPNVELVATSATDQVVLINYWFSEMMDRYRRIEEEGASEKDFVRTLIIIDEYRQFHDLVTSWWKSIKVTGMPSTCPVFDQVSSMLRLAAAARIHIVMGTQRPDAEVVGGESRDNFSSRAALGALSPDGARMMFDSHSIGTRIPRNHQGRGTWAGDGKPKEVQYFFTPDPRKAHKPEELELLARLRPATTTWPRQHVVYPDDHTLTQLVAEHPSKIAPIWMSILNATLEPLELSNPPEESPSPAEQLDEDLANQDLHDKRPTRDTDWTEDWAQTQMLPVGRLSVGDMLEHAAVWGTITGITPDEESDQLLLAWLSDDGQEDALISISEEECMPARTLLGCPT